MIKLNLKKKSTPDNFSVLLMVLILALSLTGCGKTSEEYLAEAQSFYDEEDYERALPLLEQAFKKDNTNLDAISQLTECYIMLDRWQDAAPVMESGVKVDPENFRFWFNLGSIYKYLGKYSEAVNAFDKTISLDSSKAVPFYLKADALFQLENYEGAYQASKNAYEIDRSFTDNIKLYVYTSILTGNPNDAILDLELYAYGTDDLDLLAKLAHAYLMSGDFSSASTIYFEHQSDLDEANNAFKDIVLNDIERFKKNGIDHEDFEKVIEIMSGNPIFAKVDENELGNLASTQDYRSSMILKPDITYLFMDLEGYTYLYKVDNSSQTLTAFSTSPLKGYSSDSALVGAHLITNDRDGIAKISRSASGVFYESTLVEDSQIESILAMGSRVYFSKKYDDKLTIESIDLDGQNQKILKEFGNDDYFAPTLITIIGDNLFYTLSRDRFLKLNLKNGNESEFILGDEREGYISLSNCAYSDGSLYFTQEIISDDNLIKINGVYCTVNKLYKYDLASGKTTYLSQINLPAKDVEDDGFFISFYDEEIDHIYNAGEYIYFTTEDDNLYVMKKTGEGLTYLGNSENFDFVSDNQYLYFTENDGTKNIPYRVKNGSTLDKKEALIVK
ncbi:tetratricopeptide repeat protein [Fusibacter ferrireducens]|uniref:Tetratricopeptide repeat protein n=1 Tax=Fusibacter ferrireducens TaxID=2785058 RepID=A0ABR9ZU43_9FIRM|nr:tetratricopeptide repeat protein [Fusibacter ferrireducens]MBF4693965.1 tetratricopeptide repeat protein [Fusibacter ferrireducens]